MLRVIARYSYSGLILVLTCDVLLKYFLDHYSELFSLVMLMGENLGTYKHTLVKLQSPFIFQLGHFFLGTLSWIRDDDKEEIKVPDKHVGA